MKNNTIDTVLNKRDVSRAEKIRLVLSMSLPAILAQLTSIAMQYIDAGMVGSLGAEATASIGLVSSSTWLIGGSCIGIAAGFYVQVAQLIGAGRDREAEDVLRQGLKAIILLGLAISAACLSISGRVPRWLGGEAEILADSTAYFRIYCLGVPFILIRQMSNGMMQSTGDMKTPSALSALVCLLNVVLNRLMIFPASTVHGIPIPGAGLRVVGAAIATTLSEVIISLTALYLLATRNKRISLRNKGSWKWKRQNIENAAQIGIPLFFDQVFTCSAYVAGTKIVATLGTVAVAAHSLAITAESLCYMPGYGIGAAATAIIGQTIGADGRDYVFWRAASLLNADKQRGGGGSGHRSSADRADRGTAVRRLDLLRGRVPRSRRYFAAQHHEPGEHVVRAYYAGAFPGASNGPSGLLDGDGAGAVFPRADLPGSALSRKVDEKGDGVGDLRPLG